MDEETRETLRIIDKTFHVLNDRLMAVEVQLEKLERFYDKKIGQLVQNQLRIGSSILSAEDMGQLSDMRKEIK